MRDDIPFNHFNGIFVLYTLKPLKFYVPKVLWQISKVSDYHLIDVAVMKVSGIRKSFAVLTRLSDITSITLKSLQCM